MDLKKQQQQQQQQQPLESRSRSPPPEPPLPCFFLSFFSLSFEGVEVSWGDVREKTREIEAWLCLAQ